MDGKDLLRRVRILLLEESGADFLDDRSTFDFIYEAAKELVRRTKSLTTTQAITTVANQASYDLNGDFLGLYLKQGDNRYYLKYNDGTNDVFIYFKDYEDVIYENDTTGVTIPYNFTISDKQSLYDRVTGTVTSDGAAVGNKSTLTDSGGGLGNVWPGDSVHNTTDGSDGVVVTATSATALDTCLFDGTNDDWTSGDAYIIQPQARYQITFNPPPSTAGHTATLYYLQRPVPVYCDYDVYRIPLDFTEALIKYACWLYKYRDRAPDYGDKFYLYWDHQLRQMKHGTTEARRRASWGVNLKRRR